MSGPGFAAEASQSAPRRQRSAAEELDRARSALLALDPGCDRGTWVRVAMAAKSAGLTFEDFHAWSEPAANHEGETDCRNVWRSIRADGGIGPGTLFALARDAGWRDEPAGMNARPMPMQATRRSQEPAERPRFDVAGTWAACEPATAAHAYIARKLGLPEGLRVVPADSSLRIARQSVAGWLAVPMLDGGAGDEPASLQFIGPQGGKLTAPGPMRGWFTVGGRPTPGETVYVCEGIGQAWSAHQATRAPAVVAFGAGRMETVARGLLEQAPGVRVVLVADVGQESKAKASAQALGCAWVAPPTELGKNGDINDLHQRGGLQAVAELLAQAQEPDDAGAEPDEPIEPIDESALADEHLRLLGALRTIPKAATMGKHPAERVIGWGLRHEQSGIPESVGLALAREWDRVTGGDAADVFRASDPNYMSSAPVTRASIYKLAREYGWSGEVPWPAGKPHPLARIVPVGDTVEPPAWIIPGLIAEGVTVFSGMWGAGKTTALLPLAAAAAGLHEPGYPLAPRHWRHVLYVAEDLAQVDRIVHGLARHLGVPVAAINERLHLVEARRMAPGELVKVRDHYREHFTRDAEGVPLLPLVVLDTKAATIEMEDENSNSEASKAIAALKQDFGGLPVWVIGHLAKPSAQKAVVLTARGAGAFEADAHQTMHLGADAEGAGARHWLRPAKTRFPPRWKELELELHRVEVPGVDRWGEPENVPLLWSIARPADEGAGDTSRQIGDAAVQALLDKQSAIGLLRLMAEFEGRGQYCSPISTARNNPHAMLRSETEFRLLRLKKDDVGRLVNLSQREGWLEVIPYRTTDRKERERWSVTQAGRTHAGLDSAPSAPSALSPDEGAQEPCAQGARKPAAKSKKGGSGARRRSAGTSTRKAAAGKGRA